MTLHFKPRSRNYGRSLCGHIFNFTVQSFVGQSSSMGKVHLLLWKFTHLDTNADYMLEMKELHAFLKITKKTIHPKKCSRTFMAYCDRERDHKISLNEWYFCFGVKGEVDIHQEKRKMKLKCKVVAKLFL